MPKMLVMPTTRTRFGESLVELYDAQRLNNRGEIWCIGRGVPENTVRLEWEDYLRKINTKQEIEGGLQ